MTQKWKDIWNKRTLTTDEFDLDNLIKLDGFDSGAGKIEVADWRVYSEFIGNKLGFFNGASVFEVGCGAGALLYAFKEIFGISVAGVDYSEGLIGAADIAIPDGIFEVKEAIFLETKPVYDFVVANGVFHYFDYNYATVVLKLMIEKAKLSIAIMDVPDIKMKDESESMRSNMLTHEEYKEKYFGLEHTYYERKWFVEQAEVYGLKCEFFDGCIPNYAQNRFRFGCIVRKGIL